MMKWNLFLSACLFVAGLMLKVGAPLSAVLTGVAVAALINLVQRRQAGSPAKTPAASAVVRGAVRSQA